MVDCIAEWENLHQGEYVRELPEYLSKAWHTSYALGIDPQKTDVAMYNLSEFAKMKEAYTRIFIYAHRAAKNHYSVVSGKDICIALFDENSCLMHLYGSGNEFHQILIDRNLVRRSKWDDCSLGANAVSVGVKLNQPVTMEGHQNFCRLLSDISVVFTPFSVETKVTWPGEINGAHPLKGGVALFYRCPQDRAVCEAIAFSIVREILTHLYFLYITHLSISGNKDAIFVTDIDTKGTYSILNYNASTFTQLGIPAKNLFYKRLDSIIDPRPANKELWDLLQREEIKRDLSLELRVHGVTNSYIVTILPDYERNLQIRNTHITINSEKQINSDISRKIGNNARLTFHDIIGDSPSFLRAIEQAKLTAKSDRNILILGESGSGKDIFAQAIHNASDRRSNPFIAVNCAALPRDLIASELFGYVEGAFTGAKRGGNIGKFELANTGTLFLDEIGDLPLDLQAMLLRILENSAFMRLGANKETSVDVKIISATNANIITMIDQKKFREDLYYRLSTLQLAIPPLRERGRDIVLLANRFLNLNAQRFSSLPVTLSESAERAIMQMHWRGNVRSLQNMMESLTLHHAGEIITDAHIREYMEITYGRFSASAKVNVPPAAQTGEKNVNYYRKLPKEALLQALEENHYNKTDTAQELGISRKTLYRWIREHGLDL